MKKFLFGLAALPFLAGVSLAAQPVPLSDKQMDAVTAGFDFAEINIQNLGVTVVAANFPLLAGVVCGSDGFCFLNVEGTTFQTVPGGGTGTLVQSLQVYAHFGP